jgi:hypothetical protein
MVRVLPVRRLKGMKDLRCLIGLHHWVEKTTGLPGFKCTRCGYSRVAFS